MNGHEAVNLLLTRIASAGFVVHGESIGMSIMEFEGELRLLAGRTPHHICEEEPVVYLPVVLVMPCDLRFMFDWTSGSRDLQLAQRSYQAPTYYLLLDVQVFHHHNFGRASELVQNEGYDWLDILEAGQLLAQLRQSRYCSQEQIGLGSVTTNNPGLSFESFTHTSQLHTLFDGEDARARTPLDWEYNHHVAICKERVGLHHGRLYHGVARPRS